MKVKVPEFTRCCGCVPLRAGLLAWGYFKIIADAFMTLFVAYYILSIGATYSGGGSRYTSKRRFLLQNVLSLVIIVMFVTDFVASILFVVGACVGACIEPLMVKCYHRRNVKLIRGFNIYSIVVLVLLVVLGVFFSISCWHPDIDALDLIFNASYLVIIAVHAYFILLLRSEANKLNHSNDFDFVNNPAEAQCVMASKEKEAAVEKV